MSYILLLINWLGVFDEEKRRQAKFFLLGACSSQQVLAFSK